MIDRPAYLEKLIKWKDKSDFIKIVSGVRRCGKSTLLLLFREYLKKNMVAESQIISINLEMAEYSELLSWEKLHDYVKARVLPDKMNYVLIDEIQMADEFQRAVNSLRLEKNIDLYLTGSNAYMYSQKLSTLLSGRYIEVKMFPLSFKEFVSSFDTERGALRYDLLFDVYREYGGFPDIAKFLTAEFKENPQSTAFPLQNAAGVLSEAGLYLDSLYNTIIVKDISLRTGIDSVSEINRIVRFLFSNIGSDVVQRDYEFRKQRIQILR